MNADERRKIKAVQWFMPIAHKVNESVPGRNRFIGVYRRLSAAQLPFLDYRPHFPARHEAAIELAFIFGRRWEIRTPDQRIKSLGCKTRLLLNQSLVTLANLQTNVTQGTNNLKQANRVTIAPQSFSGSSSVDVAP